MNFVKIKLLFFYLTFVDKHSHSKMERLTNMSIQLILDILKCYPKILKSSLFQLYSSNYLKFIFYFGSYKLVLLLTMRNLYYEFKIIGYKFS